MLKLLVVRLVLLLVCMCCCRRLLIFIIWVWWWLMSNIGLVLSSEISCVLRFLLVLFCICW